MRLRGYDSWKADDDGDAELGRVECSPQRDCRDCGYDWLVAGTDLCVKCTAKFRAEATRGHHDDEEFYPEVS